MGSTEPAREEDGSLTPIAHLADQGDPHESVADADEGFAYAAPLQVDPAAAAEGMDDFLAGADALAIESFGEPKASFGEPKANFGESQASFVEPKVDDCLQLVVAEPDLQIVVAEPDKQEDFNVAMQLLAEMDEMTSARASRKRAAKAATKAAGKANAKGKGKGKRQGQR